MEWHLTMLSINVLAMLAAGALFARAPCWMQKVAVVGLFTGFAVIAIAYVLGIVGVEDWRNVRALGLAVEHIGVLMYVFRLAWQRGLIHGAAA